MQGLQRERHAQTKNQTETKTETENKTTKQMTHNVQTPIWCWQITTAKTRNRKHLEMHVPQHPLEKPQAQVPVKSPRRPGGRSAGVGGVGCCWVGPGLLGW